MENRSLLEILTRMCDADGEAESSELAFEHAVDAAICFLSRNPQATEWLLMIRDKQQPLDFTAATPAPEYGESHLVVTDD